MKKGRLAAALLTSRQAPDAQWHHWPGELLEQLM